MNPYLPGHDPMQISLCYRGSFLGHCYKNFDTLDEMGNKESFGGVSEKKGKVRVRGKVNLAVSRKRSVVEQNGIKISTLWVQRGIEQSFGGVLEKKDKVRGKDKKREVSHGD